MWKKSKKNIKKCDLDNHVFIEDKVQEGTKCQCGAMTLIKRKEKLRPVNTTLYKIKKENK